MDKWIKKQDPIHILPARGPFQIEIQMKEKKKDILCKWKRKIRWAANYMGQNKFLFFIIIFNPQPRICLLILDNEEGGGKQRERKMM